MMNRTFVIIAPKLQEFAAPDWEVWFTVKLIPILPSFTAEMLLEVTADVNCTNYHVIVEGMGDVFLEMTSTRRQEITRVLVERLKEFAVKFNSPDCRKDIGSDAEWLDINLWLFSKVANYTDLKELNISGLAALESLSPDQKAELLLDPSTGAIENVPVVKEVLSSILKSRDEEQLEKFFETFVEENITYITNAGVRDAILNLTLTALAPKFPLFQTSDYELWFQINLVVLLASFRPSVLVVIPANLTCDSYDAVLKGLENALAVFPSGIGVELKSSIGELRQSAPEGCTPPRPDGVCEETVVDEVRLCESVNRDGLGSQVPSSDRLCDFGISEYACSSVASSLSSGDLVTLLTCTQPNSTTGAEAWKLFFQKVAGVLEVALSAYSSTNLSDRQPEPHVLDAIGEVKVNNFSATQLTDVSFVAHWFQGRLSPFLPAASKDFLSCLSSKNFSCDTYQVVVQALSRQASLMETTSSADWLEKNFGNFSVYATLEQLQTLNANFSSFESLTLLSPSQVAELTLSSGALNSTNQIDAVFDRLEDGDAFKNVEEFLTTLTAKPEASQ
ncbi:putative threonine-rich GPI-anchored glyco isoform X2 [Labeo rohita]|uniref:Putative threonine-rich GPI-anchored glyco isoform X2 n=1 Tax=Labeo rohita TaxID=84645 RepID=A0A498NJS9_LABRO|nr:putative threonine-rich GPI-anchored glyco isoform X2 [Labeo rohita]